MASPTTYIILYCCNFSRSNRVCPYLVKSREVKPWTLFVMCDCFPAACVVCFFCVVCCLRYALLGKRAGGNSRLLRGLQYVVEGLLAALLNLVDASSEEGRRQLPAYRVREQGRRAVLPDTIPLILRSMCVCSADILFYFFRFCFCRIVVVE